MAAAPSDLVTLSTTPGSQLYGSRRSLIQRSSSTHAWAAAAGLERHDLLGARLSRHGSTTTLETDALGLNELYCREYKNAVYFASRIAPLLAVDTDAITTDWEAWADIIAFGYPLADRTPFRDVRRMIAGSRWTVRDGHTPELSLSPWPLLPPGPAATPEQIVAAITQNVPRVSHHRPMVLLSGGWDSRLLAGITRTTSLRRPIAWTTSPDDGWDLDVALAVPVAASLQLKHRIHIPEHDAYHRYASSTRRRVQFQTYMHTWLSPLANVVRHRRSPLLDGLAGDVLLKSLFVDAATGETRDRAVRMERVQASLSVALDNPDVFDPLLSEFVRESNRSGFDRAVASIPDFPGDATVAVLLTRTVRGIAPSPLWIFAPESDVRLPFIDPAVIAAALSIPINVKTGGEYYRKVLSTACPASASLPSTNDPRSPEPRRYRRQSSPAALAWMGDLVRTSTDAMSLLPPKVAASVGNPGSSLAEGSHLNVPLRILQIASMLAEWQREFEAVLTDIGAAPWTR